MLRVLFFLLHYPEQGFFADGTSKAVFPNPTQKNTYLLPSRTRAKGADLTLRMLVSLLMEDRSYPVCPFSLSTILRFPIREKEQVRAQGRARTRRSLKKENKPVGKKERTQGSTLPYYPFSFLWVLYLSAHSAAIPSSAAALRRQR